MLGYMQGSSLPVTDTESAWSQSTASIDCIRDYRAAPIISAKDPATKAAGMPAPRATAPPVLVAEVAAWVEEAEAEVAKGVELAETLTRVALELGVAVTELTRTKVLVMVVVAKEVTSSEAMAGATAMQKRETMALNFILSFDQVRLIDSNEIRIVR